MFKKAIYWIVGILVGFVFLIMVEVFTPISSIIVGSFLGIPFGLGYIRIFTDVEKEISKKGKSQEIGSTK